MKSITSPGELKAGNLYLVNPKHDLWTLLCWKPTKRSDYKLVSTIPDSQTSSVNVWETSKLSQEIYITYVGISEEHTHLEKWYYQFVDPNMQKLYFDASSLKHLEKI